jgi:hypothetical protein
MKPVWLAAPTSPRFNAELGSRDSISQFKAKNGKAPG